MTVELTVVVAIVGTVIGLLMGLLAWVAQRLVQAIDLLTAEVKSLETRMALLEFRMERLPCGKDDSPKHCQ
jgi:hypothetical protein